MSKAVSWLRRPVQVLSAAVMTMCAVAVAAAPAFASTCNSSGGSGGFYYAGAADSSQNHEGIEGTGHVVFASNTQRRHLHNQLARLVQSSHRLRI